MKPAKSASTPSHSNRPKKTSLARSAGTDTWSKRVWSAYPTAERIVAPSAIQPQVVAASVSGLCVSCTSVKQAEHVVCGSIPAVSKAVSSRFLPHRRIPIGLSKNRGESFGDLFSIGLDRKPKAGALRIDDASHGCRDDRYAEAKILQRREPGRLDSRKQAAEVKAPDDLDESFELSTLVDVSKRPQARMGWNLTGIGPENDEFDLVSHACEDRGSIEKNGPALSLPVDPDEAQPQGRQLAVPVLRGG